MTTYGEWKAREPGPGDWEDCGWCDGTGRYGDSEWMGNWECPTCKGTGRVLIRYEPDPPER